MIDPRLGPLPIADDPFATAAERSTIARPMSDERFAAFTDPANSTKRPALTAYPGFVPAPGEAVYYLDGLTWRDCVTGAAWK